MFIAIEGGDATGKTTLCPKLALLLGAVVCKTPPEHFEKSREKVDKNASPLEKYEYYKAGVIETSSDIKRQIRDGKHVVVDRYWLTTLVYHEIIGVNTMRSDFGGILEPDLTILLSLDARVQVERMIERGLSIRDEQMIHAQKEIASSYYRNALKYGISFVTLDTLALPKDAVAEVCHKIIRCMCTKS